LRYLALNPVQNFLRGCNIAILGLPDERLNQLASARNLGFRVNLVQLRKQMLSEKFLTL
jgi:hypothetical protein